MATDSFTLTLRRERALTLLLPLFFVSGATGLTYQTVWARQLHLVFGTSTFAIATVLAAFMGGMAVGGAVMSRYADRIRSPVAAYGILELGIGLYALAFPAILSLTAPIYLGAWHLAEPPPVVFGGLQFVLVFLTLVLPTAAMGATLPLLARFATQRLGAVGDRIGTLYGVNTAGAVFGTWLCGFMLLPSLGLWLTTALAAGANLTLGAAALLLARWSREVTELTPEVDVEIDDASPLLPTILGLMALAGFASLVYEVAWTRLLALMIGASVYSFSVMLLAFLVGIAIGGWLGGRLADRILSRSGLSGVLGALIVVEVGVGLLSLGLMYTFQELPFWYVWLYDLLGASTDTRITWTVGLLLSGLIMTPPALLMGAAFPLAVRAVVGERQELGGPVGRVYAANTIGSMTGAILAGFVFLPLIHVQGTVFLAVGANLAAGTLAVFSLQSYNPRTFRVGASIAGFGALVVGLAVVVARPPWDPLLMTAGMYKYVSSFQNHTREGIRSYAVDQYDLLYYSEGLSSVVTVARNQDSGNIWLANNGKVEASTTVDMPTQILCSLLPFQFVDDPEHVLVIGLASGITAGAVTTISDVDHLDVVEIEPSIVEAARFFDDYNFGVLDDPRMNLVLNDGRNHLLLTPPGTYDIIVSEPSNPWITGVSNLFTEDFLRMGKARLAEGGVWSQWVQLYGMDSDDMRTLLATFASVYDHVLVYATVQDADLVLVGSDAPLAPTPAAGSRLRSRWPQAARALDLVDIHDELDLVSIYQLDRDHILAMSEGYPLNTDDNMRIEYRAPLNLYTSTQLDNYRVITEHAAMPLEHIGENPEIIAELARRYWARDDEIRAIKAMAEAARMQPDPVVQDAWFTEAEGWQAIFARRLDGEED